MSLVVSRSGQNTCCLTRTPQSDKKKITTKYAKTKYHKLLWKQAYGNKRHIDAFYIEVKSECLFNPKFPQIIYFRGLCASVFVSMLIFRTFYRKRRRSCIYNGIPKMWPYPCTTTWKTGHLLATPGLGQTSCTFSYTPEVKTILFKSYYPWFPQNGLLAD